MVHFALSAVVRQESSANQGSDCGMQSGWQTSATIPQPVEKLYWSSSYRTVKCSEIKVVRSWFSEYISNFKFCIFRVLNLPGK